MSALVPDGAASHPEIDANKPFYLFDKETGMRHLLEIERYTKTGHGEFGMFLTIKANVVRPKITALDDPNIIAAESVVVSSDEPGMVLDVIDADGWAQE